ncbi:MAG TPA: trigger factor [Polyangia bacterium]|jgi:trigger factor
MQLTIEDISPVEKRVDFEIPWSDVAPKLEKAYNDLRREVRLKGFRPGKVPRHVVEKLYRQKVEHDVAQELVEATIGRAIEEKQIQPVAPLEVDKIEIKAGEPFKFTAKVEIRSQVNPKDYSGVELKRRPTKLDEEQVTSSIEGYRKRLTEYKPVEGRTEALPTDLLMVEVHGKVGDHKIKRNNVGVDLEDKTGGPLPGLAERLQGVSLTATDLEVKYKLPDDLPQKELAGQHVNLRVTVKDAREKKQRELDDEFAKDTGEAETLEGLKDKIRERLKESDGKRVDAELRSQLVKAIVARNEFPIAPALVDRHAGAIVNRALQQLMMAGIDVQAGLEAGAIDVAKMKQEFKTEAEAEARGSILLQAIAEREGITASDADLQKRIAEIAASRQENAKKLRADMEREGQLAGLRQQLLEQKTLDMLISQAKITDEDPERLILTPAEAANEGTSIEGESKKKRNR